MTSGSSFVIHSHREILSSLHAFEPNWRWTTASSLPPGECSLQFSRQNLHASSITAAEHSVALQAVARRHLARVGIYFVLAGGLKVGGRSGRTLVSIPPNHVASICEAPGKRLTIEPRSSWLAFHMAEPALRQHFERLTGSPYLQEFVLSPTGFCREDVHGLYQTLRQAEQDMACSSSEQRPLLAKAYQQLALAKLFAKMPHNLVGATGRGTLGDAPRQLLQAEDFMRKNLSKPITIDDLAGAAECSPRALQRMFQSFRGGSPIGTLCNYRLAAAHSAIRSGQTSSITDLALSLQFSNPGRFSVLYKNAYGLSPSSTLRFARGDGKEDETC